MSRLCRPALRGMTLVEMLVAMAASLMLMAAVAQVFGAFSGAMSNSRAILETDGRLRNVARRLRDDLRGVTVQLLPPRNPEQGEGYFEVIEGPLGDSSGALGEDLDGDNAIDSGEDVNGNGILDVPDVAATDIDDVLLFTTRSTGTPFIGRGPTNSSNAANLTDMFESPVAEVAWFARPTVPATTPATYTLYRKQLLVMGYVGVDPFYSAPGGDNALDFDAYDGNTGGYDGDFDGDGNDGEWSEYFNAPCDISVRRERDTLYPNTLADLTRRENRFMHNRGGVTDGTPFPFPFVDHTIASTSSAVETLPTALEGLVFDSTSQRQGEDIVLTNVLAFDVRVFDPAAPVRNSGNGTAVVPGDPGFTTGTDAGSGCYVDLGHGVTANSLITPNPLFSASTGTVGGSGDTLTRTYCTWSTHYEANGIDDDGDGLVDQGTDGLDDNGNGLIDDADEQETAPPYPYPLRGIEVRIRVYEPTSRQVRQVTVRQTFVPH